MRRPILISLLIGALPAMAEEARPLDLAIPPVAIERSAAQADIAPPAAPPVPSPRFGLFGGIERKFAFLPEPPPGASGARDFAAYDFTLGLKVTLPFDWR
ncbi:MAG: hypothetical protein FJX46_09775 [Alphaproteobacteria bacterium]|nr:hypothetical protein [Alphaproteobacteria bacterium]